MVNKTLILPCHNNKGILIVLKVFSAFLMSRYGYFSLFQHNQTGRNTTSSQARPAAGQMVFVLGRGGSHLLSFICPNPSTAYSPMYSKHDTPPVTLVLFSL